MFKGELSVVLNVLYHLALESTTTSNIESDGWRKSAMESDPPKLEKNSEGWRKFYILVLIMKGWRGLHVLLKASRALWMNGIFLKYPRG